MRHRAALCGLALLAAACSANGGQGSSDGTFTMAIAADPDNLNPLASSSAYTHAIGRFMYDSLVYLRPDGSITSGLATSWKQGPTGVTFTLGKGITCAGGTPLKPSDLAADFAYVTDPRNGSQLLGGNVPAGLKAKADDRAGTLTLTVTKPDPFLLRKTADVLLVCPRGLRDPGLLKRGADGTGPYTLSEAVADDHYTLVKRTGYRWGPGGLTSAEPGLPDKVVFKVVKNETTAASLLLAGQINAASVRGADRQRLEAAKLFTRQARAVLGEMFFNQAKGRPGADERVRRALATALDLPELAKALTGGTGLPTQSLVTVEPKACAGDSVTGNLPAHDPEQAKALLAQAGWGRNGKPLGLTLLYTSELGARATATAELMAQRLRPLGIELTVKQAVRGEFAQIVFGSGDWDITLLPIGASLPTDLTPFVSGPTPPKGSNFAHIGNPDYERAVAKAAGGGGCTDWLAAESALVRRVDVVPFADDTIPIFAGGARFEVVAGEVSPQSIRMTTR
ncbi:ABC transporter substrate-binding protein [Nonomuraea sediminis]|uniref:ABC transporter substrate-binding protein n=1 Tax=Nonomuraea sediminis TaxID=2835864 RepID=UPI001BDCC387|nr:ABC transporter substrate-binding protein [Nonomuraea sediminis]